MLTPFSVIVFLSLIPATSAGSFNLANARQNVADLTPKEYSQGKSFVRELNGTIAALQDPNVASYINRKWAPKGNTVGAIVTAMNQKGMKFAPATPGDEPAYTAMYRGLVAYLTWDPARPWDTLTK